MKKLFATILAIGGLAISGTCSMGCVLLIIDEPEFFME